MKTTEEQLSLKDRLNDLLARHWKIVVIALAFIILAIVGVVVLSGLSKERMVTSSMLAEDIQEAYTTWMSAAEEDRDSSQLEALIDQAIEDLPRSFAAQRAFFTQGLVALENDDWSAAAESFLTVQEKWKDGYLASVSLFNAGSALEESGDLVRAGEVWQKLVDDYAAVSADVPEALFNLGRLAEAQDDREGARVHYEAVVSQFPGSRWTNLAKSRILSIDGRS